jgi:squalene-hopene/tetraprenyl-beta-curcumene cyclase
MRRVSTSNAGLLLWLEGAAIAIAYAAIGTARVRRVAVLAAVLAAHAVLAALAWRLAGGPGELGALLRVRAIFIAEALAAYGLAAALVRLRVEGGLAATAAAAIVLLLVVAPAPGEAIGGVSARTASYAVSPSFAASAVLGLDLMHDPALYGRVPAAVMETHMTPWIWTAGSFLAAGMMLVLLATSRRRARRAAVLALLAAVALAACKKDEKKEPEKAPEKKEPEATKPADAAPAKPTVDAAAVKAAIDKGVEFLAKSRGDGDWIGGHPGTTAMATLAMVSADGGPNKDDARVKPSLDALAKLAKKDGAIFDKDFPVYVTAITVLAFQKAGVQPEIIKKAQAWLAGKQFDESNKVDPKDPNYGGVGYGVDVKEPDADLSNMHFALEALKESDLKDRAEVIKRAQKFLERCQNRSESNDQEWAGNDGGFVYKPGASKAGGTASTGSMTEAGVAAFLYADVDKADPRVAAAIDWLRDHYSVDENPGLGTKGLFYHYHMMARSLGMLGEKEFVDGDGNKHDWAAELAAKLVGMQKPDGSWANEDQTYWENNPALATSRALLALEYAYAAMK